MHSIGQRGFLRVVVPTHTWVDSRDALEGNGQIGKGRRGDVVSCICGWVAAVPFKACPEPIYWLDECYWVWPWVQ